jgi:hypothetical protein
VAEAITITKDKGKNQKAAYTLSLPMMVENLSCNCHHTIAGDYSFSALVHTSLWSLLYSYQRLVRETTMQRLAKAVDES